MAVQQLYYTSCEQGLSGFSGFQFNAVSPGVSADTMSAVETLCGYEPPRSMLNSEAPDDLARCPVNLCFVPGNGTGATAVCVHYTGRDSARRFGNYFAHALHSTDFARESEGLLGIQLWDSPEWTASAVAPNEIPELAEPPRAGPLTPEQVGRFLAAQPHAAEQVPNLLAAAFAALEEKRSVVVVDASTDLIAHWFAAVCYLLPPPLARRLSFATYLHTPGRSRLHLIGTVPGTRIDIGPDDQLTYRVFDFAAGQFPPEGSIPVHHLVRLLARIKVPQATAVWSWAEHTYVSGAERDQGDWHAPLAAAAASGGVVLEAADVQAVVDWCAHAGHLGELQAAVARDIYLRHPDLDDAQLATLSTAARDGGDVDLHHELEGRLYESRMRAAMNGAADAVRPVLLDDPAVRQLALTCWQELLRDADDGQAVRLFSWALGSGLTLAPEIAGAARDRLARSLLESAATRPASDALRSDVKKLFEASRAFRQSLVRGLAELMAERPGQQALFAVFPAYLLREEDLRDHPVLLEHFWTARTERQPELAVEYLFRILWLRRADVPDAGLLRALWPIRRWTHAEAVDVVRRMNSGQLVSRDVSLWFDQVVKRPVEDEEQLDDCVELCRLLAHPHRAAWLLPETGECVAKVLDLTELLNRAHTAGVLAESFMAPVTDRWAPTRALKRMRLPSALVARPVEPLAVPLILSRLGDRTADAYLREVLQAVTAQVRATQVILSHVTGLVLARRAPQQLPMIQSDLVLQIVRHAGLSWHTADTERLAEKVRPYEPAYADSLLDAAAQRLSRGVKLTRRFKQFRSDNAPKESTPKTPKTRNPANTASTDERNSRKKKNQKDEGR